MRSTRLRKRQASETTMREDVLVVFTSSIEQSNRSYDIVGDAKFLMVRTVNVVSYHTYLH